MCNEQNGFAFGLWIICVFMDIFFKCGIDLRLVLALEMGSLLLVARCTDVSDVIGKCHTQGELMSPRDPKQIRIQALALLPLVVVVVIASKAQFVKQVFLGRGAAAVAVQPRVVRRWCFGNIELNFTSSSRASSATS